MKKTWQHYASLFTHNPDAVTSLDLDGNFTSINKAGEQISGYSVAELLSMSLFDILPEDTTHAKRDSILQGIRRGEQRTFSLTIRHKQGHHIDLSVTTFPIILDNEIVGQYGIAKDITEQKRTKEALLLIEQDFEEMVNQQLGMTFKFVKQGDRYIHTVCGGDLVYRTGVTPEQVIGYDLFDFMPYEIAKKKVGYYERAWNGESVLYEGYANGVTYLASLKPVIRNGKVAEVIASCIDITERKQMEEALRKSEENYRLIAENALDLIRILDPDGTIKFASPSHSKVLQYSPESLVGKLCFDLIHPEQREQAKSDFQQMIEQKKPVAHEYSFTNGSMHTMLFEVKGMPVLGDNGEVESVVVVARDISERKHAENLLRNSDKLSVIGELAAGIAHEIRNPLTALKGFIQLLQSNRDSSHLYLEVMLSEIDRINLITGELLLLAKPQALDFKIHDLDALLHSVTTLLEPQLNLKNVRIKALYEAGLQITCEEKQIKQVFINIIKNGIEAMPNGGEIVIEVKKTDQDNVLIRFIDQGCGIPAELIRKLGEPFYSTKEKGTGLGLMVSYKIIKEHHGSISIESEVYKGTTVNVMLPLHAR